MNVCTTSMRLVAMLVPSLAMAAESPAPTNAPDQFRLAVFNLQADPKAPLSSDALTDRVLAICGAMDSVKLVDRAELVRVAGEHKLSLSGLTDPGQGVQLGRFVSATHILVGRLTPIGQSNYLILKIVDVETTEQQVISMRAPVTDDLEELFAGLDDKIAAALAASTDQAGSDTAFRLSVPSWLQGKAVVIDITETHVSRPLTDPACATTAFNLLKRLGVNTIMPSAPPSGWQDSVRASGRYLEKDVDFLLEGEGVSSFAAEIQGMTSCRGRVELRLVPVPGREVLHATTGVGAKVDLVEALAAKAALEEATEDALTALLRAETGAIDEQ